MGFKKRLADSNPCAPTAIVKNEPTIVMSQPAYAAAIINTPPMMQAMWIVKCTVREDALDDDVTLLTNGDQKFACVRDAQSAGGC